MQDSSAGSSVGSEDANDLNSENASDQNSDSIPPSVGGGSSSAVTNNGVKEVQHWTHVRLDP